MWVWLESYWPTWTYIRNNIHRNCVNGSGTLMTHLFVKSIISLFKHLFCYKNSLLLHNSIQEKSCFFVKLRYTVQRLIKNIMANYWIEKHIPFSRNKFIFQQFKQFIRIFFKDFSRVFSNPEHLLKHSISKWIVSQGNDKNYS